jgi:hypothetical protein
MDQFKKYLREHRSQLDVETPPPFEFIGAEHTDAPSSPIRVMPWIAAASIVIIVSTLGYLLLTAPDQKTNPVIVNTDSTVLKQAIDSIQAAVPSITTISDKTAPERPASKHMDGKKDPSNQTTVSRRPLKKSKIETSPLQSLETNYAAVINYQLKRLERTPIYGESADYFHVFKKQWYDLEKDEEKIRQQLSLDGISDVVVDQFIQLYQNKIALLKQLQTEIEKMNLRARNHPDFSDQSPTYLKM